MSKEQNENLGSASGHTFYFYCKAGIYAQVHCEHSEIVTFSNNDYHDLDVITFKFQIYIHSDMM